MCVTVLVVLSVVAVDVRDNVGGVVCVAVDVRDSVGGVDNSDDGV
jgi:hypothetical protein